MTTITRIRTEHEARLHVEQDTDATVLDCFLVTLPPYTSGPMLVYREGADMNVLWSEALAMVAYLRAQPWKAIHPPHVFQPFGVITARWLEDVRRETELRREMMLGELCLPAELERLARIDPKVAQQFHERGVQHLCRVLDLLDGAPLPVAIPWPDFKGLH
jgi:hypothetical protein